MGAEEQERDPAVALKGSKQSPADLKQNEKSVPVRPFSVEPRWDGNRWLVVVRLDGAVLNMTVNEAQGVRKQMTEVICEILIHTDYRGPGVKGKKK